MERSNALAEAAFEAGILQHLHAKRPLQLRGAAVELLKAFGLEVAGDVAVALTRGGELGATSAHKRGEAYLRENIFLAYLDQATLILARAERFFPALLSACEALASRSFDFVSAKLILEPPSCHQAPPLVPEGDVLVVQLWGTQRLSVVRPTAGLPVTAPRPQAAVAAVLQPGDALFVPAGMECRASRPLQDFAVSSSAPPDEGGPLLYALLVLRTTEQSMDVSLGKYLNDLLREEGRFSKDADKFMRTAITKQTLSASRGGPPEKQTEDLSASRDGSPEKQTAGTDSTLAARLGKCASELSSCVSAEGFRQHYAQRMAKLRSEQRESAASTALALTPGVLTDSSTVRVTSGVVCHCEGGGTVAYFKRGTKTLNLPIAESASYLIQGLSDGVCHRVGSLSCADPFERLCVCQVLISKECLEEVH